MENFEKIQKKIIFDYLCARVRISFNLKDEINKIDKKAGALILEMSGYKHLRKRELDLYYPDGEKDDEIIVLDEGFSVYNTDIKDVLIRKAPTIKEMLSFKNAKKIINDSNVVVSRKEDTLKKLRDSFIDSLNFNKIENKGEIAKKAIIEFDALEYKDFLKSVLIISELLGFVFLKGLSSKLKANAFIKYHDNFSGSDIESIMIFDENAESFLLFSDEVKAKDSKKYFKDIVSNEIKPALEKRDALLRLKEMLDSIKEYSPLKTNLFLYGVPDEIPGLES